MYIYVVLRVEGEGVLSLNVASTRTQFTPVLRAQKWSQVKMNCCPVHLGM